jgi:hypothetical protein
MKSARTIAARPRAATDGLSGPSGATTHPARSRRRDREFAASLVFIIHLHADVPNCCGDFYRRPRAAHSVPPRTKPREVKRREAQHFSPPRFRAARALRQRARLPALHRGDFGLRDRSFRDADGGLFARPITRLSPRSSCPVQPTEGQSPVVGTDGDPRPPECPADEAEPAGAAPHSANKRHRLTPLE